MRLSHAGGSPLGVSIVGAGGRPAVRRDRSNLCTIPRSSILPVTASSLTSPTGARRDCTVRRGSIDHEGDGERECSWMGASNGRWRLRRPRHSRGNCAAGAGMSARTTPSDLQVRVARQLALDVATGEVVDALAREGTRVILLKGAAISARLYDGPGERLYRDIDLLAEPGSLAEAERVLRLLGFRDPLTNASATERTVHATTWLRTDVRGQIAVDLHTGLFWCTGDPPALWRELSHNTRTVELAGMPVEVLDDPGLALVIAAHAVQHADPQPVEDLRRALM